MSLVVIGSGSLVGMLRSKDYTIATGFNMNMDVSSIVLLSSNSHVIGTGFFFVEPTLIVTARHVLFEKNDVLRNVVAHVPQVFGDTIIIREVKVGLEMDFYPKDICALRAEIPEDVRVNSPLNPTGKHVGEMIEGIVLGYSPGNSKRDEKSIKAFRATQLAILDSGADEGYIGLLGFESSEVEQGNSGAPLVDLSGNVIGVLVRAIGVGSPNFEEATITHGAAELIDPVFQWLSGRQPPT